MEAIMEKTNENVNSNNTMSRKQFLEKTVMGMAAVALVGKFGSTALNASSLVNSKDNSGSQVVGPVAPSDKSKVWIDTSVGGVQKFWNGFAWTPVKATWG